MNRDELAFVINQAIITWQNNISDSPTKSAFEPTRLPFYLADMILYRFKEQEKDIWQKALTKWESKEPILGGYGDWLRRQVEA